MKEFLISAVFFTATIGPCFGYILSKNNFEMQWHGQKHYLLGNK